MRYIVATLVLLGTSTLPLQATTHYVSPQGDDAQSGTREEPLRTISTAAKRAMPGDIVHVLEGVYRERVTPQHGGLPGKPIIYRGEPGKRVVIKGSEVWTPAWKNVGAGIYSASPDDSLFNDRSAEYVDHYNPLKVNLSSTPWHRMGKPEEERGFGGDLDLVYTCGQVFVDGQQFLEVPFQKELEEGSWYYEPESESVYVHFGDRKPSDCVVELTTRRRIFAPQERGLGHIVVEGFVFEHCGNQYPTNFWMDDANAQKGAVGIEAGHHWIIRRNVIRYAKTFALDVGHVDRHSKRISVDSNLVEENYIVDNGSAGILSNSSKNLVIRGNVILRNNHLRFLGLKRWEQAGIKCHNIRDGHIYGNYIADNYDTYGIWLDNQFPDSRVSRNVIHSNGRAGIFLEMSDYGFDRLLVDNNLIFDNKENAVYIHDASGATFVNNLLANTEDAAGYGQAIYILQVSARTKTYHHSFFNNLLIGNARNVEVNYPAVRSGIQRFESNLYGVEPEDRAFVINDKSDKPSPWSPEEFRELVRADLGPESLSSDVLIRDGRAHLTLSEWQRFWQHHETDHDAYSRCDSSNQVHYEPEDHSLTINVQYDLAQYGARDHSAAERDFFRDERPADGAIPGPFRQLHQGTNRFTIWSGLDPIGAHELPPVDWNTN